MIIYSFESATALLAIRNTLNEDLEDEEEEEEEGDWKICIHEQVLHCIMK
jgi:hypothetical protein